MVPDGHDGLWYSPAHLQHTSYDFLCFSATSTGTRISAQQTPKLPELFEVQIPLNKKPWVGGWVGGPDGHHLKQSVCGRGDAPNSMHTTLFLCVLLPWHLTIWSTIRQLLAAVDRLCNTDCTVSSSCSDTATLAPPKSPATAGSSAGGSCLCSG